MQKKNSIANNYIYNLIYQIIVIIVPLITAPYLSRVLGAERIGIYSYTISIVTYFILFGSLGVASYGRREIAYVQDDIHKRSEIFYEIFIMRFITLTLSMITFYFCFCLHGQYVLYFRILVLELISNIIDISWFFQGLEEFKKTVLRNCFVKIISVVAILIFVKSYKDLNIYFLIYVLSTFFANVLLWFYLPKFICKVKIKSLHIKRHLAPTISLFIPQVAIQVYNVLDKTMIGFIVADKSQVGFYEQSEKVIKLMLTISTSLGTVMTPRMANTFAKGNSKKLKDYMSKSFAFTLMLAFPLMFGLISIASNFVPLFFGKGYDEVIRLMCVISPIIIAVSLSNVTGIQYLLPTKQQKKYTISVISGAIINFCLNLFLIRRYSALGASISTVIAEFTVTGVQFYLIKEQLKFIDIIKNSYKCLIAAIIMFVISSIIGCFIPQSAFYLIIQITVSVISYFSLLIVFKDKFLLEIIEKFKKKFSIRGVKNYEKKN